MLWWNYLTYSSIGIRKKNTDRRVDSSTARIIRFRPAEGLDISHKLKWATTDVDIYLRCGNRYELGFLEVNLTREGLDEQIQWLGHVSNKVMTSPPSVGLSFSGMMIGLYVISNYHQSSNPADFHFLECKRLRTEEGDSDFK